MASARSCRQRFYAVRFISVFPRESLQKFELKLLSQFFKSALHEADKNVTWHILGEKRKRKKIKVNFVSSFLFWCIYSH